MRIALTGASGFIGRAVAARMETVAVSTRGEIAVPPVDAVVHLAGEPVAQRWTPEAKRRIYASRVDGTRRLVASLPPEVKTLVSASAVGYYGSRGDEVLTEQSAPGNDFLAGLAVEWERAAAEARDRGVRVVSLRIGLALGRDGGALPRMARGVKLGSGRQWLSWIHLDDLVSLIEFVLDNESVSGPVNATAPAPVTNAEFTRTLGGRALPLAPAFLLRLALGEMAGMLLASQRAIPQAAQAAGFRFRYPELAGALLALH